MTDVGSQAPSINKNEIRAWVENTEVERNEATEVNCVNNMTNYASVIGQNA